MYKIISELKDLDKNDYEKMKLLHRYKLLEKKYISLDLQFPFHDLNSHYYKIEMDFMVLKDIIKNKGYNVEDL